MHDRRCGGDDLTRLEVPRGRGEPGFGPKWRQPWSVKGLVLSYISVALLSKYFLSVGILSGKFRISIAIHWILFHWLGVWSEG